MFEYTSDNKHYHTLNYENKIKYGEKIWKASVDGGFTCPNIDGKCGYGGCIFCDNGSGYFTRNNISISEQILLETKRIHKKNPDAKIIAYFQKNTNTYDTIENLRKKYYEALNMPYIIGLSIGTRADCIDSNIMELLKELNNKTNLTIELGLQSSNDETADFINRGYNFEKFKETYYKLRQNNIRTCIHIINGIPYETIDNMIQTAYDTGKLKPQGIKIQMLHIIKGTLLEKLYEKNKFNMLSLNDYAEITSEQLEYLPPETVVERITGDGDKDKLIAPFWSMDKKNVMNTIDKYMAKNNIWQGDKFIE